MIEAFELKRKGCYKQAIEVYYKQLSEIGDNVEILSELADLYYLLENYDRARHYISKALEIKPNHISSLRIMIKIYEAEADYDNALSLAEEIYTQTASDTDLLTVLNFLEYRGSYDEVIKYAKDTEDIQCLYKLAHAMYKLERFEDALSILNRIMPEVSGDDSEKVLNLIGKIYYNENNINKAKEVFEKLEENNSQTAEGLNYIGLNKLDELNPDEAIKYFDEAIKKDDKSPNYFYNMGQAYFLKGWLDEAHKCFNTAICLNPMEEKYHYSLAYLYYKKGDYTDAEAHLNPEYFESKVLLQVIKAEKGDLAGAKVELEKMLNDNPDNETILYSLAKIYYNLDMYKQSRTIMEKVLEINSKSFDYHLLNINVLIKLGLFEEAKTEIDALIEKYPNYYYAKVLEGELNLVIQDYDALFDTAQDLIELDCNHYEGYYYNALALFEKDDINFAIESLKKAISLDVANAELYVKMSEFYQAIGRYEDAFAYIKEASDIDRSAKNQELYMQLAGILRQKGGLQQEE